MKTKSWLLYALMGAALTFTACVDSDKELYNPEDNQPTSEIPEGFDWSMTKDVNLIINVADLHNGKYNYNVKVFTQKPGNGILPINAGIARQDIPFMGKITIPETVTTIYIEQSLNRPDGSIAEIKSQSVNVTELNDLNYSFESTTRGITTRGDENRIPLTPGMEIKKDQNYVIEAGVTYSFTKKNPNLQNSSIKVYGTLNCPDSPNTINANNKGEFKIIIETGGQITGNGLAMGAHTELENKGSITLKSLTIENDAELDNKGCIRADIITYASNNKGDDNIESDDDSFMECNTLHLKSQGAVIELESGSWLIVNKKLIVEGKDCKIKSDDEDQNILVQLKGEISYDSNGTLQVDKNILVECKEIYLSNFLNSTTDATGKYKPTNIACAPAFGEGNEEGQTTLETYTYVMEDMYPVLGDYDMNDIVVTTTSTKSINNTGNLTKLTIKGHLRAVGASKKIAASFALKGINANDIESVTSDALANISIKVDSKGNPMIPIFTDAHAFMGAEKNYYINVDAEENNLKADAKEFNIEIKFKNETITASEFSDSNIDFFITTGNTDIYLYDPKTKDYLSNDGYVWGLKIPGRFNYPSEKNNIKLAYKSFEGWIMSNKTNHKDWYIDGNIDDQYIVNNN